VVDSGVLIEAAELQAALGSASPPTVLDVRWRLNAPSAIDDHRRSHIPGSHFVDLDSELAGPPGAGRHPLPDLEVFGAAMRRCGVSRGRPVVIYDTADAISASRAWWMLRYTGHPDVRVLDGGLLAWMEADLLLAAGETPDDVGDFVPSPGNAALLDAAGAAMLATRGVLLDARSPERYRGEAEPIDPVAGHIPGARNAPATANLAAGGRFLHPDVLRARFASLGVHPGDEVGAYCGSGITAAHEVLALAVAGIPAALYVGSWSDWITDSRRPISIGDQHDS